MNDLPDPPLDQTEREMLGRGREVTYNYRCSRCRHEDAVPDVVIAGFAASAGLTRGRMPRLVCPECGGPLQAVGDCRRDRLQKGHRVSTAPAPRGSSGRRGSAGCRARASHLARPGQRNRPGAGCVS